MLETLKPIFIISLDLELLWGLINAKDKSAKKIINILLNNKDKVRKGIDMLLSIFEKYRIPATWATVGHLFLDHCEKIDGIPHKHMPRPRPDWYDKDPCTNINKDPLFYGKDIIEKIISSNIEHEIGYHSFSHVIFPECSREVCEAEIREGIKLAKEFGIKLNSFVFPENKVAHVDILKKYGFKIYRGRVATRYDKDQNIILRLIYGSFHTFVAYPVEPEWKDGIWEIKSSMLFFHPYFGSHTLLFKAKHGIDRAIKTRRVFHIHMHPHDIVLCRSLIFSLEKLLKYVAKRRDEGKLLVMTMGQLATIMGGK